MIECPKCEKNIEINDDWQCPECGAYYDLCHTCKERLPDVEDFGVTICNECLSENPEAKNHLNSMAENERMMEGRY